MAPYFLTLAVPTVYKHLVGNKKFFCDRKDVTQKVMVIISFIVPIIIYACRNVTIGRDTASYCKTFNVIQSYSLKDIIFREYEEFEMGYLLFCKFLSFFGKNARTLLVGTGVLINMLHARVIYKQDSSLVMVALFSYYFLGNYLLNISLFRQAIAVGIVLNAFEFLQSKKYIAYIILVLLATCFHSFAIIYLAFVPAVMIIKTRKQLICAMTAFAILILSTLEVVHIIVLKYFDHFDYYFRRNYNSENTLGITSFAYIAIEMVVLVILLYGNSINENNRIEMIILCISLTGAIFGLIMMPTFGIYERIAKYFQPILILAIPKSIKTIKSRSLHNVAKWTVLTYGLTYYSYMLLSDPYNLVPFEFYT